MSNETIHEDDDQDDTEECATCGQTVDRDVLDENGNCDECCEDEDAD